MICLMVATRSGLCLIVFGDNNRGSIESTISSDTLILSDIYRLDPVFYLRFRVASGTRGSQDQPAHPIRINPIKGKSGIASH